MVFDHSGTKQLHHASNSFVQRTKLVPPLFWALSFFCGNYLFNIGLSNFDDLIFERTFILKNLTTKIIETQKALKTSFLYKELNNKVA